MAVPTREKLASYGIEVLVVVFGILIYHGELQAPEHNDRRHTLLDMWRNHSDVCRKFEDIQSSLTDVSGR